MGEPSRAIALRLALDHPAVVRTLALLEPPLFAVPSPEPSWTARDGRCRPTPREIVQERWPAS